MGRDQRYPRNQESDGSINIKQGLKINGTDVTANLSAAIGTPIAGVAAGYKLARGLLTPAAAQTTVITGLATVVAAIVGFKAAPTLTHDNNAADFGNQSGAPAAGSFLLNTYGRTSNSNPTPVAGATPWSEVEWIAIGT